MPLVMTTSRPGRKRKAPRQLIDRFGGVFLPKMQVYSRIRAEELQNGVARVLVGVRGKLAFKTSCRGARCCNRSGKA